MDSTIINELLTYRANALMAGHNPQTVTLSQDQRTRLNAYFDEVDERTVFPIIEDRGVILGMEIEAG